MIDLDTLAIHEIAKHAADLVRHGRRPAPPVPDQVTALLEHAAANGWLATGTGGR